MVQRKVEVTWWVSGPCRTLTLLTWLSYRDIAYSNSAYTNVGELRIAGCWVTRDIPEHSAFETTTLLMLCKWKQDAFFCGGSGIIGLPNVVVSPQCTRWWPSQVMLKVLGLMLMCSSLCLESLEWLPKFTWPASKLCFNPASLHDSVNLESFQMHIDYNYYLSFIVLVFSSVVKRLIAINRIQNKSFCLHNICVCTVYIYYVYINTNMHVSI